MKFVAFVPVHNRCQETLLFIENLQTSLKTIVSHDIWILDDGSTDRTSELVREQYPTVKVHDLDGSYYWGGCINETNRILTQNYFEEEVLVGLFNNDTVQTSFGLRQAIEELNSYDIVCPSVLHISSREDEVVRSYEDNPIRVYETFEKAGRIDFGQSFDSVNFKFHDNLKPGLTNVSHTVGLVARKNIYLSCSIIPKNIPHYLSDYYLTMMATRLGYLVYVSSKYVVFRLENNVSKKSTCSPRFAKWLEFKLSVRSQGYLPAWISFRKKFSTERLKYAHLFGMYLNLFVLRIFGTVFNHGF